MKLLNFRKNKEKRKISNNIIWPDHITELNKKNFEEFIEKYPLSIVDFWAPWCAPCKAMAPRLRRLSKIYKGKVAFAKINTQKYQETSKKYKISGIPNLIIFKNGKKISNITGLKSVGELKEIIDKFVKNY